MENQPLHKNNPFSSTGLFAHRVNQILFSRNHISHRHSFVWGLFCYKIKGSNKKNQVTQPTGQGLKKSETPSSLAVGKQIEAEKRGGG